MKAIYEKVEPILIAQISDENVCHLTNASILSNSLNLEKECMEFISAAMASKTPFNEIEILDKDVDSKILPNSFYEIVETQ
uniref:Uncharacterized protein n=1 Tax=Panagrolaimus davidi TaxID=227884 RepID=A0A914Q477_9BILA